MFLQEKDMFQMWKVHNLSPNHVNYLDQENLLQNILWSNSETLCLNNCHIIGVK